MTEDFSGYRRGVQRGGGWYNGVHDHDDGDYDDDGGGWERGGGWDNKRTECRPIPNHTIPHQPYHTS